MVILLTLACPLSRFAAGQTAHGARPYKGPRALGLLELTAKGKTHFIPIAILVNGEFYDAGAYKASPVPMALWTETVYEGLKTGVSQGLFTVTAALQNSQTNEWIGEGTWLPAGSIPAKSAKKPESSVPRGVNEDEGPPVLRHSGTNKPAPPEAPNTSDANKPEAPQTSPAPKDKPTEPIAPAQTQAPASPPPAHPEEPDPNAPVLRRGKPDPKPLEPEPSRESPTAKPATKPPAAAAPPKPQVQVIPAISDANGSDPRPYAYNLKPEEEEQFRKKMLALAAEEVVARAKQVAPESAAVQSNHSPGRKTSARKAPQPDLQDIQLRVFDLSSSNEAVLSLTANAQMPTSSGDSSSSLQYSVALVAREDINGDLHKAFVQVTDSQHLDVLPRYELIDAVDADGDGRGELLFRQVSDAGTAYSIYRVIGDRLYPLFQGTPQR